MLALITLIGVVVVLVAVATVYELWATRPRQIRLSQRDRMPLDQWVRSYAEWKQLPAENVVLSVLEFFSEAFDVEPTRFRPDDRLAIDLVSDAWLPHGDESWEFIRDEFRLRFARDWDTSWRTIADVIEGVAEKTGSCG